MANYKSLKTTINANVKRNGNQEITGQILNSVLNAMVETLGTGYSFAGVATPNTDPGTPDAKVFYIANGKGKYTHFGELEVTEDDVVVLYWDSLWHKESTGIAKESNLTNLEKEVATKQNALTDTDGGYGQRVANLEKKGIASEEKLSELGQEINGLDADSASATLAVTAGTAVSINNSLRTCRLLKGRTYRVVMSGAMNTIAMYFRNADNTESIKVEKGGSLIDTLSFTPVYNEYTITPIDDVYYVRFYAGANLIVETGDIVFSFNASAIKGLSDLVDDIVSKVNDIDGIVYNEGEDNTIIETQTVVSGSSINKKIDIPAIGGQAFSFKVEKTGGTTSNYFVYHTKNYLGNNFEYGKEYRFLFSSQLINLTFGNTDVEGSDADVIFTIKTYQISKLEDIGKMAFYENETQEIILDKYINTLDTVMKSPKDLTNAACSMGEINAGDILSVSGEGSSKAVGLVAFYDKEKNLIFTSYNASIKNPDRYEIFAPEGTAYFAYNTYPYSTENASAIVKRVRTIEETFSDIEKLKENNENSPDFTGKTIVCFGDSITEFAGVSGFTYSQYLENITGAKVINVGIGGTRIGCRTTPVESPSNATEGYANLDCASIVKAVSTQNYDIVDAGAVYIRDNASDDNTATIARLKTIDWAKVDVVTFLIGTNDWGGGQPIGTSGDNNMTTTLGAINFIISTLLTAYPHIKVYWFTPLVRWLSPRTEEDWSSNKASNGRTLEELAELIMFEVSKQGIPVCDMYHTLGWNKYNFSQYFLETDGTHPYKGFLEIARKIAGFLNANRTF